MFNILQILYILKRLMKKTTSGSTESKSSFWETIDLLLAGEDRKTDKDKRDEALDWADRLVGKRNSFAASRIPKRPRRTLEQILKSSVRGDSSTLSDFSMEMHEDEVERFVQGLDLPKLDCKFSSLAIRNKLEMLMGSNLVSLTDRDYMTYLQVRILDDYEKAIEKRIAIRQAEEMERVKNLVLTGRISLDEAPMEMANHPVMLIDQYCKKVLAERRAKMKILRPFIPKYLYWDDTPDPPSGLSIECGHWLRPNNERLCMPAEVFLATEDSENIADGYMMPEDEFEKLNYEAPYIKTLRETETVDEMYDAADAILGLIVPVEEGDTSTIRSAV